MKIHFFLESIDSIWRLHFEIFDKISLAGPLDRKQSNSLKLLVKFFVDFFNKNTHENLLDFSRNLIERFERFSNETSLKSCDVPSSTIIM